MDDKIIAEAIDSKTLEWRGKDGEKIPYAPKEKKPYTGWVKSMHDDEQIGFLGQYKDGKKDGLHTHWYSNGQKWDRITYKEGKKDGLWTEWHAKGRKKEEINFKDGKKDGLATVWPDDWSKLVGNFKDGKKDGVWIRYKKDGTEDRRETYKDGYKDGKLVD